MNWAEASEIIERGGIVKREAWAGHVVMVKEPAGVRELDAPGHEHHPLQGLLKTVRYAPYLLQVDTLTGEASPFQPGYANFAADDWHEVTV